MQGCYKRCYSEDRKKFEITNKVRDLPREGTPHMIFIHPRTDDY